MEDASPRHRVVIVGGGFGGLRAAQLLSGAGVDITIVDERNHHLFQPLLYQVATASLSTSAIGWPIRSIFRNRLDVRTVLARVRGVDVAAKTVLLEQGAPLAYDTLILATGARHSYFGHDDWEQYAPGLKTFEDAIEVRRRILLAFERAEVETDAARQDALLTFVVVGGGPTGVELAGTVADLARDTLAPDFRRINTRHARIVLIEAGACVLPGYPPELSDYARRALEGLGVEVMLGAAVSDITADKVVFGDREIATRTVIWAAGVRASAAADWLGVESDKAGRVVVDPDLTVPDHPEIFAIGDTAKMARPDGSPVPGIAPAAKQGGAYVASVIRARLISQPAPPPFAYHHQGSLAQIGKRKAVIDFGWIRLRGAIAWWLWGIAHIYFLIGVRTRLAVALDWLWISVRNQRSSRLITRPSAVEAEDGRKG